MLLPAFPKDRLEEEYSYDDLQAMQNEMGLYAVVCEDSGETGAEKDGGRQG